MYKTVQNFRFQSAMHYMSAKRDWQPSDVSCQPQPTQTHMGCAGSTVLWPSKECITNSWRCIQAIRTVLAGHTPLADHVMCTSENKLLKPLVAPQSKHVQLANTSAHIGCTKQKRFSCMKISTQLLWLSFWSFHPPPAKGYNWPIAFMDALIG